MGKGDEASQCRPRSPCKRSAADRGRTAAVGSAKRGGLFSRLACDIAAMARILTPSHSRRMANRWPALTRVYATGSRNAAHPVNAILNYAYAVLQSQVQIKAVADGYDPMLGIMHYERDGSPAFVFDMMEPERPKVDRAVLGIPQIGGVASGGFHDPRGWGGEAKSGAGEAGGGANGRARPVVMIHVPRYPFLWNLRYD